MNRYARYTWCFGTLVLVTIACPVLSQLKFSGGVELGANMSGLPRESQRNDSYYRVAESDVPFVRPMPGLWGKVQARRFFASIGIQYVHVGNTNVRESVGVGQMDGYRSRTESTFQFEKACYPWSSVMI